MIVRADSASVLAVPSSEALTTSIANVMKLCTEFILISPNLHERCRLQLGRNCLNAMILRTSVRAASLPQREVELAIRYENHRKILDINRILYIDFGSCRQVQSL